MTIGDSGDQEAQTEEPRARTEAHLSDFFGRGEAFARQLIAENERLRRELAGESGDPSAPRSSVVEDLLVRVAGLEEALKEALEGGSNGGGEAAELRARCAALASEKQALEADKLALEADKESLAEALALANTGAIDPTEHAGLKDQVAALEGEKRELEVALAAAKESASATPASEATASESASESASDATASEATPGIDPSEHASLIERVAALEGEKRELEAALAAAKDAAAAAPEAPATPMIDAAEHASLQERVATLEGEKRDLEAALAAAKDAATAAPGAPATPTIDAAEHARLHDRVAALEGEKRDLEAALAAAKDAATAAPEGPATPTIDAAAHANLQERVATLEREKRDLEVALADAKAATFQAQSGDAAEHAALEARVDGLVHEKRALEIALESANAALQSAKIAASSGDASEYEALKSRYELLVARHDLIVADKKSLEAALASASAAVANAALKAVDPASIRELEERCVALAAERRALEEGSTRLEAENYQLATLTIAIQQLHGGKSFPDVFQTITEVCLNFLGIGCFSLWIVDEPRSSVFPVLREGAHIEELEERSLVADGPLAALVGLGRPWQGGDPVSREYGVLMFLPLVSRDRLMGVLCLESFLPQKSELSDEDFAVLAMVSEHAGLALENAWNRANAPATPLSAATVLALTQA